MAREHARLERRADGSWHISDLGHDGPMYLNKVRIRAAQLASGDVLVCGGVTLRFELG